MKNLLLVFLLNFFVLDLCYSEDVLRPGGRNSPDTFNRPLSFGIEAGLNVNKLNQDLSWAPFYFDSPQGALSSGNGFSPLISILVDIGISSKFGLEIRATYDNKYVENSKSIVMDYDLINDRLVVSNSLQRKTVNGKSGIEGSLTIKSDVDYNYQTSFSYLNFSPMIWYEIIPHLKLALGPIIQFPLTDVETKKEYQIINEFLPGNKKVTSITEIYSLKPRYGLEFGISYDFQLSNTIGLAPFARYQLMLTKFQDSYITTDPPTGVDADEITFLNVNPILLNSLQIGLKLKFSI